MMPIGLLRNMNPFVARCWQRYIRHFRNPYHGLPIWQTALTFLLDAFGVLNIGETATPSALVQIGQQQAAGTRRSRWLESVKVCLAL
jgi:hypothetical protein